MGHALREVFADRWVRFHALPKAKRYAEDSAEHAEILMRGNTLATELLGEGQACWLMATSWQRAGAAGILADMVQYWKVTGPTAHFDADELQVYAKPIVWRPRSFDALLHAIADDQMRAVFALPGNGRVFAPYDGGFDVICSTGADREFLKARYVDWISARDDML